MSETVQIVINVSQQGAEAFKRTSEGLKQIQSAAKDSSGHIQVFGKNITDLKSGFDVISNASKTVYNMVDGMNALGAGSIRARNALDSLSNGGAVSFLKEMREGTKGLVTDFDLASQASKALGLRVISTAEEAGKLAKYGAILGQNFLGDAGQGVETLTLALSRVGLVQLLDNVGLSGERVRKRFNELKEAGMGMQQAWSTAVFEDAAKNVGKLEGALTGAGTAWERFKTRISNSSAQYAENFVTGFDAILNGINEINKHPPEIVIPVVFK